MARARHEGRIWLGTLVGGAIATVLLLLALWYVGDDGNTDGLRSWMFAAWRAVGIHGLIALSYFVRPKKDPEAGSAVAARDPEHVPDLLVRRAGKDEEQVR